VTVEYAITPLGETLARTMDALRVWSADHIGEVVRARDAFDTRTALDTWPHRKSVAA